jgi:hypothetical protein
MRKNKIIGVLIVLIGVFILLYKDAGFYGFGGYVDKSWENITISSIFIIIGFILVKRNKRTN